MKKIFLLLCVMCFVLLSNSFLMAGGVDNRSNLSGEYIRSLNRNAATDSLDAIAYNPAGVMSMENGEHVNFSVHFVTKDYTNTVGGIALESDTPSFVPSLFGLYKRDKWAGFFGITIPAGGGKVEYDSGNATTRIGGTGLANQLNAGAIALGAPGATYGPITNEKLEGEAIYYGFTVGGAYKVDDSISFSLAGRLISARKELDAGLQVGPTALGTFLGAPARTVALNYEEEATGFGLIFGMSIDYGSLNMGIRYETETDLDFEYEVGRDTITGLPSGLGASMGVINGREHARNLPAALGVGYGYKITPKLRVDVNLTTYFQDDADWGGAENFVSDSWEGGIAIEYMPNPDLKLSVGYLYTETGMHSSRALKEAPELDARSIGAGFSYNYNENMKIDCGIGMVDYVSDAYTDTSSGTPLVIGLEKDVLFLSAAVQYRF